MQRDERRAVRVRLSCFAGIWPLVALCPLLLAVNGAEAAPRQNEAPARATVDADTRFDASKPLAPLSRWNNTKNGLQYTITRVEMADALPNGDKPKLMSDSTVSTPRDDNELMKLVSSRTEGVLRTLQKSGIVETVMRFLAPQQRQIPDQQQLAELRQKQEQYQSTQRRDLPMDKPPRLEGGRIAMSDSPVFASSLDAQPEFASESKPADILDGAADWKHTLFGPRGMFTEIFNMINEKRKEDERQRANIAAAAAAAVASAAKTHSDAPAQPDLAADFTKIIDSFLSKTQSGTFDEPPPEIPFLGICDRLSCGDIYKAFDEFRKSELFTNFQTAISLLHDQKGWDIIGEMLANPDLIDTFTGGGAAPGSGTATQTGNGAVAGSAKSAAFAKGVATAGNGVGATLESTDGGDIGVDFSEMVDERPAGSGKPVDKPHSRPLGGALTGDGDMPEIAENVDYYSSVNKGEVEEKVPSQPQPKTPIETNNRSFSAITPPLVMVGRAMPEISESVDEYPDGMTDQVDVEETVSAGSGAAKSTVDSKSINNSSNKSGLPASNSSVGVPSPLPVPDTMQVAKVFGGNGSRIISSAIEAGNAFRVPLTPTRSKSVGTTRTPPPVPRTTRKNFRRFNDYYSMYYDTTN